MIATTFEPLITYPEAAKALGISKAQLARLVARGQVPPGVVCRLGNPGRKGRAIRFNPARLREWIDQGCPAA